MEDYPDDDIEFYGEYPYNDYDPDDEYLGQCAQCGCPIKTEFGLCANCDYELDLKRKAELADSDKPPEQSPETKEGKE